MGFVSISVVGGNGLVDQEMMGDFGLLNLGFGGGEFASLQSLGRSSAFCFSFFTGERGDKERKKIGNWRKEN